jgi:hypothetical protein
MERIPDDSKLQRLLGIKRHETPPPAYFERFPSTVIARIRAGEKGEEASFLSILSEPGWLRRLFGVLEARSALAGAAGIAVCGILLAGLFHSDTTSDATAGLMQLAPATGSFHPVSFEAQPLGAPETLSPTTLTNPLAPPSDSLFKEFDRARTPQSLLIDFQPGQ